MLLPSIFGNDFFDDFMNFPTASFDRNFRNMERDFGTVGGLMRTDVLENENGYEVRIDLPGFKKEDVKAQLKDGYLTITATRESKTEDKKEKYLRRERYMGSVSRSFYVGETLTEEDIKAKFEDGILKIALPKKELQKVKEDRYIAIEG